jgi:hypothetical protein
MASVSNIAANAAIAIPNMAAMSNAAALVIQLQEILMDQAILSAGSLLQANAATFIFDNEIFAPVIGL